MSEAIDNRVTVLVLQHPQEQDHALGTAGLLVRTLSDARMVVGLSWRNLAHAVGVPSAEPKDWGVLYLGSVHATGKGPLVAVDRKGVALADQKAGLTGLKGLIVLDGSWAQAKTLWWRNAWLSRLRRFVIVPDAPSLYGSLRKEARPDAVSTLEAAALALSVLETDKTVRERLLAPFRDMLARARETRVPPAKIDWRKRRPRSKSARPRSAG